MHSVRGRAFAQALPFEHLGQTGKVDGVGRNQRVRERERLIAAERTMLAQQSRDRDGIAKDSRHQRMPRFGVEPRDNDQWYREHGCGKSVGPARLAPCQVQLAP